MADDDHARHITSPLTSMYTLLSPGCGKLASHLDAIVRPAMIARVTLKNVLHISHRALRVRVVLSGAREPRARILDVDLARRVVVAEEAPRQDRDQVLLVVDMRDGGNRGMRVDVVRERLVSNTREAVADVGDLEAGDVQREVDGVQERDGPTFGRDKKVREDG